MADAESIDAPNFLQPDGRETGIEVGHSTTIEAKSAIGDVHGLSGAVRHHVLRPGKLDGEIRTLTITGRFDGLVDYDTGHLDIGHLPSKGGILANCVQLTRTDADGHETTFRVPRGLIVPPRPPAEEQPA